MEIKELEAKGKELRQQIAALHREHTAMLKYDALEEQIVKLLAEIPGIEAKMLEVKDRMNADKQKQEEAVTSFSAEFAERMSVFLPFGDAFLDIASDGRLSIGWVIKNSRIPCQALSGGQRSVFDAALCYALAGTKDQVIVAEGAEADPEYLRDLLEHIHYNMPKVQVLVSSWHVPYGELTGWQVVPLQNSAHTA